MPNSGNDTRTASKSSVPIDYEAVYEHAPCGYLIIGDDGLITAVNETFLSWAGHTRQALLGTSLARLLPVGDQILYSTHVAPQLRVTGSVAEVVIDIVAADGSRRPALLSASRTAGSATTPGQTRVIIFSAAERHRYEQELIAALQRAHESDARRQRVANELRESEGLFRQLADSVDVAFFLHRGDPAEFLYASPGYVKIFGYDPMVTTPTPPPVHIHPEDRDRFQRDYWIPSHQGRPAQIDYRLVRPDGQTRWIRSNTAPALHTESGQWRYATTSEDITKSRQAEAALLAAEVAERANAAKNDFLSRMSHELRTPLNAVLGFAQLLELDPLTGEQESGVQHILRGGRHLLGLIDDVLEIAKIDSDHLDLSVELVPVANLLSETVQLMMPQAQGSGVTLRFEPATVTPYRVHADQRRLRQVLINLLSNAIKYNRRGGRIIVRCRTGPSQSGADARLDIDVIDTGQGIRVQDLPRLFTPFDRLGAESKGIEGSGVGLALSRRLMTLMGGTLTATSEIGVGSIFTISVPLSSQHWEEPAAEVAAAAIDGSPPERSLHARTLLYIEDNSSNVELMEQLISRRPGWRMLIAGNGKLGIELAGTAGIHLVLLDLHLPDINGMDVLRTLRADPATRQVKIVVLSADANPHQQERLRDAGADAYFTKPIDVAKVLALLDRPPSGG